MRKYYLYGQLFACLEIINQGEQEARFGSNPDVSVECNQRRLSTLLRNHRRRLNEMDIQNARILELELANLFRQLPAEPFPFLQTNEHRYDFDEGYRYQLQKLAGELKRTAIGEVV
jgi:hypothetical protein